MKTRIPIVSAEDHARLHEVIESARRRGSASPRELAALETELGRAQVVAEADVPPGTVAMNSVVRVRDLDWDETETYTLVYPLDADIARNRISVLAPVGAALLGYREGDLIEWPVAGGVRRLRVKKVVADPDRICAASA